jgi:hypothetical protein
VKCPKCKSKGGPKETLLSENVAIQRVGKGLAKRVVRRVVSRSYRVTNCCVFCRPPRIAGS